VLTAEGRTRRAELRARAHAQAAELLDLPAADQVRLRDLLVRIQPGSAACPEGPAA
jgi:hypothetical protein